jgi:DNA-binding LacI/PurR family transcriptional regulator
MPRTEASEIKAEGPKYKRIYQKLREVLSDGTYAQGTKLPSENDLVESFGASRPTIRRALAQLETEGFIQKRMGSGTVVAQQGSRKSHVFGLLIPELGMTEIFEPICQGISQSHAGAQHDLLWGPTFAPGISKELQAEKLCHYYIDRKVSGVFFAPMELIDGQDEVNLKIVRALEEAHIPIVLLDRDIALFPARSQFDVVGIDNHRAGYMLTEHLLLSGSRRIGFLARPNSAHTVNMRISGYQAALLQHLNAVDTALVKWADPADPLVLRAFIEQNQPDAILCANDYTAAQLLTTLNTLNIQVPQQIRVTGIDDVKYARLLQTPLTTIHQPCREMGAIALQAMLIRIANPSGPANDYLVDFQLIVRKSSDPDADKLAEIDQPALRNSTLKSSAEEQASTLLAV